ncbi:MAG: carboxypeptidase regulatory-like domain-containing protein, partial [Proteobacteria bacterium]|nr:carboxypeptidase regulatory-like domain-containing protein [Pseudomonadota bacterium]
MLKRTTMQLMCAVGLLLMSFCTAQAFTPGSVQVTVQEDFYSAEPIAGAAVLMKPGNYSAVTGDNGTVLFTDIIPYRNYSVTVTATGYPEDKYGTGRTGFIWVETGAATNVTMPLKKAASVSGTVTDTKGAPVAGAMVVLVEERLGAMEPVATTHTISDGSYLLAGVPEGDYSIRAVADSYYQVSEDLPLAAGDTASQNFIIKKGSTSLGFHISPSQTFYGNSVTLNPSNPILQLFNTQYVAVVAKPEGAELVKSSSSSFIPTLPGDYRFAMMVIDGKGVGREMVETITMVNDPPVAFPSVIPGPSELPLLYDNGTVFAETNGLNAVKPGGKVYLRGWGEDNNMPSPEVYNTRAYSHETANPLFDIYGNKNGDWSQSDFGFAWTLKDGAGADRTSLLDNASSENTWFTVPADAKTGGTFTASLTVMGDAGLASAPVPVTVYIAEDVGTDACAACHRDTYKTYQNTKHAKNDIGCETCHGP